MRQRVHKASSFEADRTSTVIERQSPAKLRRYARHAGAAGVAIATVLYFSHASGVDKNVDKTEENGTQNQTYQPTPAEESQLLRQENIATETAAVQEQVINDVQAQKTMRFFWGNVTYFSHNNEASTMTVVNPVIKTRGDLGIHSLDRSQEDAPYAVVGIYGGQVGASDPMKNIVPIATLAEENYGYLQFTSHDGKQFITPALEGLNDNYRISEYYAFGELQAAFYQDGRVSSLAAMDGTAVGLFALEESVLSRPTG